MLHKKKNKKQVYLNACTRKNQDSSFKAFFYSSTMVEKKIAENYNRRAKLGHKRARESKRERPKRNES